MHNISALWSPQDNRMVDRWNADIDLIWYIWSVTKPFLLSWILRTMEEMVTQVLKAKLFGRSSRLVSAHTFSCCFCHWHWGAFCYAPKCVLSSCFQPTPSKSWPWQRQQGDYNWTEWEVRLQLVITCWLKAQMETNSVKMLVQQQCKR